MTHFHVPSKRWTEAEIEKLNGMLGASKEELCAAFPKRKWASIDGRRRFQSITDEQREKRRQHNRKWGKS